MARKIKDFLKTLDYKGAFFALLGAAIMAFGTNIYADVGIPEGGIVGICLMIENLTGAPTEITSLLMNAFLYLLSWRLLGSSFIFNAGVATVSFSAFYAFFDETIPPMEFFLDYPLLAALVGAIIIETGTGIILRFGGAPSSDHAISVALAKRGNLSLGWMNFIRDFVVILLAYTYVDDPYLIVYAILIMTITIPIMDYIAKPRNNDDDDVFNYKKKSSKKTWIGIIVTGLILALIVGVFTMYVTEFYHADEVSIKDYHSAVVDKVELSEGVTAYLPNDKEADKGLIFYPGGKVEYTSYEPLLIECAERGIACVVIEMPYNLAVFGINKALDVPALLPEIDSWYIGGHSLGGSMAATCAASNPDVFEGVVLLAAYSTSDLASLKVLTVYGSNDGVMNMGKYNTYKDNLPKKYEEHVIIGGCHAYFGVYGAQEGDGTPSISNKEQIDITAEYIANFINK